MKRIAVVLAVVMVALMLFVGCGVPQAEVDEQVSAAYDEGYDQGYNVGYSEGETTGYNMAYDESYEDGYSDGYNTCQRERSGEEIPAALDQYQNSALVYRPVELSYSMAGCDHYLIHMRGEITALSGRTITIAAEDDPDDTFSIEIGADVPVLAYAAGETVVKNNNTFQDAKEIEFESLQVGDNVFLVLDLSMCAPEFPEAFSLFFDD